MISICAILGCQIVGIVTITYINILLIQETQPPMLQILITFIWIGSLIPEDYLVRLSHTTHPYEIYLNPLIDPTTAPGKIQADIFRLEALQKVGGVYSDLDNQINYECLMGRLEGFTGEMMLMEDSSDPGMLRTNFMYVPKNNTKLVK